MRTRYITINKEKILSVLVAGNGEFKIYSNTNTSDWIIVIGVKKFSFADSHNEYQLISDYVNLKYQNIDRQQAIQKEFENLIAQLKS